MLVAFSPILPYDLSMVEPCLGTIFSYASFVQPSEVGLLTSNNPSFVEMLDQETRNIRNKSYNRLVDTLLTNTGIGQDCNSDAEYIDQKLRGTC
jgi:hypothetical protein